MNENKLTIKIIFFMLFIYCISAIQFTVRESQVLMDLSRMTYAQKIDHLDKPYYRNIYYKYYLWLHSIIPKDMSFSILYDDSSANIHTRYLRKLNYYFYPRHVLLDGVDQYAYHKKKTELLKDTVYSDFVLTLKNSNIRYSSYNGIKFTHLNGKRFYLMAQNDDKELLIKGSFIKNEIKRDLTKYKKLNWEFKKLYRVPIQKVRF